MFYGLALARAIAALSAKLLRFCDDLKFVQQDETSHLLKKMVNDSSIR
jgi:predicted AAA+ superfamily ATPase